MIVENNSEIIPAEAETIIAEILDLKLDPIEHQIVSMKIVPKVEGF